MALEQVTHWERHPLEATTVDELFDAVRALHDRLAERGGQVTTIAMNAALLDADIEYRIETDDEVEALFGTETAYRDQQSRGPISAVRQRFRAALCCSSLRGARA